MISHTFLYFIDLLEQICDSMNVFNFAGKVFFTESLRVSAVIRIRSEQ